MLEELDTMLADKGLMIPLDLGAKGRLEDPFLFVVMYRGHHFSDLVICV